MRMWSGTQKKTGEKEIFHGLKMSKCGDGDGMLWLAEHRDFRFLYHLLLPVSLFYFKYVFGVHGSLCMAKFEVSGDGFQIA